MAAMVAVVVVLGITLTGGDDPQPRAAAEHGRAARRGDPVGRRRGRRRDVDERGAQRVNRGEVTVAVLNGTTVTGLARGASDKLTKAGFKPGVVTNDTTNQARSATAVLYADGNRRAALDVAARGAASAATRSSRSTRRRACSPARTPTSWSASARTSRSSTRSMIHLARHGQTAYNAEGRFQGHLPVPLDDTGRAQAEALAEAAAGVEIALAVVQPAAARATETAEVVGAAHRPRAAERRALRRDRHRRLDRPLVRRDPRRGPRRLPPLPGLRPGRSATRAASRSPSRPRAWPTGLADLRATGGALPALVVCHRGVIRLALAAASGDPTAGGREIPNAALVTL